jgi:hypothetical protein
MRALNDIPLNDSRRQYPMSHDPVVKALERWQFIGNGLMVDPETTTEVDCCGRGSGGQCPEKRRTDRDCEAGLVATSEVIASQLPVL